jgi:hypothetical protein
MRELIEHMWSHLHMDFGGSRRIAALGLALAALSLAALAPVASAAPGVSSARALTPEAPAAEASAPQGMSLEFTANTASVAGPGALVSVRCVGTAAATCVGTLSIAAPGEPPEVAYSLSRGEDRVVVVPLGSQRSIFDGIISVKTRVVAHTVQAEGGSVRTARTLRFK